MPQSPLKPCGVCGRATRGRVCALHATMQPERSWPDRPLVVRIRGRELQQRRMLLFQRQPLCQLCLRKRPAVYSAAAFRDHVIPLTEGGTEAVENEQALCSACHVEKTHAESMRGKRRRSTGEVH